MVPVIPKPRSPAPVLPVPRQWGMVALFLGVPTAIGVVLGAVVGIVAPRVPSMVVCGAAGFFIGVQTLLRVLAYGATVQSHSAHRD